MGATEQETGSAKSQVRPRDHQENYEHGLQHGTITNNFWPKLNVKIPAGFVRINHIPNIMNHTVLFISSID